MVDGVPPGIPLTEEDIQVWLDKRRPGQGKFVTQRQEPDRVRILSGVFEGLTTGAPVSLHGPVGVGPVATPMRNPVIAWLLETPDTVQMRSARWSAIDHSPGVSNTRLG